MNYICTQIIIILNDWKCKEKYEKNKRLKIAIKPSNNQTIMRGNRVTVHTLWVLQ